MIARGLVFLWVCADGALVRSLLAPTKRGDDGFSLIEMIIALAIVAILMAVSTVAWKGARRNAANERTRAHMEQVAIAVTRARDERQQPLSALVSIDGYAACAGSAALRVGELNGSCRAAWEAAARGLAPWLVSEEAARELLVDGSGRAIILQLGERGCAGNDHVVAPSAGGAWGSGEQRIAIDTSRYSC